MSPKSSRLGRVRGRGEVRQGGKCLGSGVSSLVTGKQQRLLYLLACYDVIMEDVMASPVRLCDEATRDDVSMTSLFRQIVEEDKSLK